MVSEHIRPIGESGFLRQEAKLPLSSDLFQRSRILKKKTDLFCPETGSDDDATDSGCLLAQFAPVILRTRIPMINRKISHSRKSKLVLLLLADYFAKSQTWVTYSDGAVVVGSAT